MNLKKWIPLVAAVLLGVIALVVAKKALSKGSGTDGKSPFMAVQVAKKDIPPGREITADDITPMKIDVSSLPGQQFFIKPEDLIGRTTLFPMSKGQTVVEQVLAPTGTRGGITALIPPGMRAMTIEVNEFTGVAGMIQPGSKVDIIAVLRDEKNGQPAARTILQDIEVRAVGSNVSPVQPTDGPQPHPSANVTLLLTLKQAQTMQLASQNGRPWLVLRNGGDTKQTEASMTTLAELRNEANRIDGSAPTTIPSNIGIASNDPFAGGPRPITTARVVQVIRGGVESTVTFNDNGTSNASQDPSASPATRPAAPKRAVGDRMVTDLDRRPVEQ